MFQDHPWEFYKEGSVRYLIHYGLVMVGFILAAITMIVQWRDPAPYGKHASNKANWGPAVPQRIGHMISDSVPGVLMFTLVFHYYGDKEKIQIGSFLVSGFYTMSTGITVWGMLHPFMMRYRSKTVPLGISAGTIFPNILYHFLCADFISNADFRDDYISDPRFVIGVILYIVGYVINRWADWKLRSLRDSKDSSVYYIPYGGLYELVVMPNYLGELIEWLGWSLATWSLAGLIWTLFGAATFIPRSRHNLMWYRSKFESYPKNRKALIPYVF